LNLTMVIVVSCLLVFLLLSVTTSFKPIQLLGNVFIKLLIGALFLFFLNALGGQYGLHVPINLVNSVIAGILGIPGVIALAIIQMWIVV